MEEAKEEIFDLRQGINEQEPQDEKLLVDQDEITASTVKHIYDELLMYQF